MSSYRQRVKALDQLYAKLPAFECKGLCQSGCENFGVSRTEYQRMKKAGGLRPAGPNGECPYLEDGRCSIYEARPMVCRLFGMVGGTLKCSHGCQPVMSDEAGYRLLKAAYEIGGPNVTVFHPCSEGRMNWMKLMQERVGLSKQQAISLGVQAVRRGIAG